MAEITIQIDIENPNKILEKEKGKFSLLLASLFLDSKRIKKEVEQRVCAEVIRQLEPQINERLTARGVKAKVNFTVKE